MPNLTWIGKKAVENHHRQVPFHLLKEEPGLSVGDPGTGNLLVEGDNLLALKALLPYYAGQVKCIYIDPPYNTGNEGWIYNDNMNSPEIRKWLGKVVGDELEDLTRHDKWLCMIYPRFAILRELLRDDGVIVVHIDENEIENCFSVLGEIFGRRNSLGYVVWDKGNPKGDSEGIACQHETLYAFAKNKDAFLKKTPLHRKKENAEAMLKKAGSFFKKIGKTCFPEDLQEVSKIYGIPLSIISKHEKIYSLKDVNTEFQKWIKKQDSLSGGEAMYKNIASDGRVYRLASMAWPNKKKAPEDYFIPLQHPKTGKNCPVPARGWRNPSKKMKELLGEGLIEFGEDHTTQPQRIYYLDENMSENVPSVVRYAGSDDALFSDMGIQFENPKPYKFSAQVISWFSGEGDLILDSFSGSGTAGHAVMQLNSQERGNRRFILVQMPFEAEEQKQKDENIARDITAKRLRRVCEGYKKPNGETVEGLGGGFRFATLGEPLFDERGEIRKTVRFADLARHVYFTETGEPLPKQAKVNTPLIGVCRGVGVYLLYNGILKDKSPDGGNVLTTSVLIHLPQHAGPKVVYGTACRLGAERLRRENIVFKQLPYKLKVDAL